MTYLICEQCGGYYELREGEKVEDFSDECECGGKLYYAESLQDLESLQDSEGSVISTSGMALNHDLDPDLESVVIENQSRNHDDIIENYHIDDYQNDTLIDTKETIEKGKVPPNESKLDKSELKDFKLAVEMQEILDVKGYFIIQGNGPGQSIKILSDGIEVDNGQFIGYSDVISIQDKYNPIIAKKSSIGGLISSGYSLIASKNWSFKITYTEGELEFNGVKKSDAQRFVSFVNRIIKHR